MRTPKRDQNRVSKSTKSTSPKVEHTAKIKLVPRGQQNRLHLNEDIKKKKQNRVSRSTKSTSPKEEHCKNKYASKSPPTTSSKERHPPERDANRNQKGESLKTEGQKAILHIYESKNHHIAI